MNINVLHLSMYIGGQRSGIVPYSANFSSRPEYTHCFPTYCYVIVRSHKILTSTQRNFTAFLLKRWVIEMFFGPVQHLPPISVS